MKLHQLFTLLSSIKTGITRCKIILHVAGGSLKRLFSKFPVNCTCYASKLMHRFNASENKKLVLSTINFILSLETKETFKIYHDNVIH